MPILTFPPFFQRIVQHSLPKLSYTRGRCTTCVNVNKRPSSSSLPSFPCCCVSVSPKSDNQQQRALVVGLSPQTGLGGPSPDFQFHLVFLPPLCFLVAGLENTVFSGLLSCSRSSTKVVPQAIICVPSLLLWGREGRIRA